MAQNEVDKKANTIYASYIPPVYISIVYCGKLLFARLAIFSSFYIL